MSETQLINLYNEDNISVCRKSNKKFDLIYGDCMYESKNTDWIIHAIASLKDNGIFIIQTDYHSLYRHLSNMQYYIGTDQMAFVNHLIYMNNWGGVPKNRFAQKHDDILVYCKGTEWKWYPERIQIPKATAGTAFDKKGTGTKTPPSVFYDHASFSTMSNERIRVGDDYTSFSMQKPEWLMERLLLQFTDEKDEVLDMFMGTGTLGVMCKKYNRNYTGIEIDKDIFSSASARINNESPIQTNN